VVVSNENTPIKINCSKISSLAEIFCSIPSEFKDFFRTEVTFKYFKGLAIATVKFNDLTKDAWQQRVPTSLRKSNWSFQEPYISKDDRTSPKQQFYMHAWASIV